MLSTNWEDDENLDFRHREKNYPRRGRRLIVLQNIANAERCNDTHTGSGLCMSPHSEENTLIYFLIIHMSEILHLKFKFWSSS
jgi:hypothetical protein